MPMLTMNLTEDEDASLRGLVAELQDQRAKSILPSRGSPGYRAAVAERAVRVTLKSIMMLALEELLARDLGYVASRLSGGRDLRAGRPGAPLVPLTKLEPLSKDEWTVVNREASYCARSRAEPAERLARLHDKLVNDPRLIALSAPIYAGWLSGKPLKSPYARVSPISPISPIED